MAAAKFCCAVPLRSESPDNTPSRPVKPFRSLANIKLHFANSRHASTATDGVMEENRPLYPADDLELQRIFVTASLPEDHPYALRINGRKPGVDESIIRSPSFTDKLRRQLSRKSLATGAANPETIKRPMIKPFGRSRKPMQQPTGFSTDYDDDAQSLYLAESRLASLQHNDETFVLFGSTDRDIGDRAVPLPEIGGSTSLLPDEPRRSISVPLTSCRPDHMHQPTRSQSSSSIHNDSNNMLTVQLSGPKFIDANEIWPMSSSTSQTASIYPSEMPAIRDVNSPAATSHEIQHESTVSPISPSVSRHSRMLQDKPSSTEKSKMTQKGSNNSLHLYDMQISQHLRSKSHLSDASCTSDMDRQNRMTHASLNSVMISSMDLEHRRDMSSSGFISSTVPSIWGKVLEDESSSIYSRRPSTALETRPFSAEQSPAISGASPLEEPTIRSGPGSDRTSKKHFVSSSETLAPRSDITVSPMINVLACGGNDPFPCPAASNPDNWPTHSTTCSSPKSDSSGSLGKVSRFKEDLSNLPVATKTKRKNRSFLHVFFPRIARSRMRSTSTLLIGDDKVHPAVSTYDGPGDVQDLLSVPQPASRQESRERSVSFNDLVEVRSTNDLSSTPLTSTPSNQSRQSMVDYERNLSVVGDSRRRKSTLGGPKGYGRTVSSDDQHEPERVLHRAAPLFKPGRKGTEEALMEKALQQHQLEKAALLRTSNKKTEVTTIVSHAPVFKSPFIGSFTKDSQQEPLATEDLDPLEAESPSIACRGQSMHGTLRSRISSGGSLLPSNKKPSTTRTMDTAATEDTVRCSHAHVPPRSWSQYPSHTRDGRCSTAGRTDGITSRDFAYTEDQSHLHRVDSSDDVSKSPRRWSRLASVKRNWIVKSRSMTFGTVFRYYSNILTSSAARNRRSSTATGGRLEHPELEVLPPILASHSSHAQVARAVEANDQPQSLVQQVGKEGHHIKEERSIPIRHGHGSSPGTELLPEATTQSDHEDDSTSSDLQKGMQIEHLAQRTDSSAALDGTIESMPVNPERALSARRLSRMYQAYVQLPTSADNTESEPSGLSDNLIQAVSGLAVSDMVRDDSDASNIGFLASSTTKPRMYSSPIVRRFPSATVVDDRKGHWRSISLMSVDSGKSVRKSTRDLLEFVRATESQELEKLVGKTRTS